MTPATDATAVNQLNPLRSFKSILRGSPLPTPEKVAIAARVLRGKYLQELASEMGVTPQALSRAINASGNVGAAMRRRVVELLGLDLEDIAAYGGHADHAPNVAQAASQINGN
jgi:hypothetical protein